MAHALVISICNEKGGVGKTILAITFAQELQRRGYKVLLIDSDKQSNATSFYGAVNGNGIGTVDDMLCEDEDASTCIQHCENGDVIPGDPQLAFAEQRVIRDGNEYDHLKMSIEKIKDDYDFIVMDTPRGYGIVLQNVLAASDYIITPVEGQYALDGVVDFYISVDKFTRKNNPDLVKLGIVANKIRTNTKSAKKLLSEAEEIAETANVQNFKAALPLAEAIDTGITQKKKPVFKYDAKSKAQTQIEALVADVLKEIQKTPKGKDLKIRRIKE